MACRLSVRKKPPTTQPESIGTSVSALSMYLEWMKSEAPEIRSAKPSNRISWEQELSEFGRACFALKNCESLRAGGDFGSIALKNGEKRTEIRPVECRKVLFQGFLLQSFADARLKKVLADADDVVEDEDSVGFF